MKSPFYILFVAVLISFPGAWAAAQSRSSLAVTAGANSLYDSDAPLGFYAFTSDFNGSGTLATTSVNRTFTGLNSNGQSKTMTFIGSASAVGNYGILRTTGVGTLSNTFFNSSNAPFYDADNDEVNQNGIPDTFLAGGSAGYSDVLQYGGTAQGYKSRYTFSIHGNVSGTHARTFLNVSIAGNNESFEVLGTGEVFQTFTTNAYFIGTSGLTMNVSLTSRFEVTTNGLAEGITVTGKSLFDQTVSLSGIEVTDQSGNVVTNYTLNSASGTTYVPEPAAASLIIAGSIAFLAMRRRSSTSIFA